MLLHNSSSFIKLPHSFERILVVYPWSVSKIVEKHGLSTICIYSIIHYHLNFSIIQRILFAELLSDHHVILFVNLNQLLSIYNKLWCSNNLTNILQYNLYLVLLLTFLFLRIVLYQNWWGGHRSFSVDDDIIILDNTFW